MGDGSLFDGRTETDSPQTARPLSRRQTHLRARTERISHSAPALGQVGRAVDDGQSGQACQDARAVVDGERCDGFARPQAQEGMCGVFVLCMWLFLLLLLW